MWFPTVRKHRTSFLRLRGVHAVTRYIVNEVRTYNVCRALRLTISTSKLSFVRCCVKATIESAGSSDFLEGEQVEYSRVSRSRTAN